MARAALTDKKTSFFEADKIFVSERKQYEDLEANTIAEHLYKHRKLKGWSQMELALNLGFSKIQGRYRIKDYETRNLFPPRDISIRLAKLFELNTKYFYDDYYEFLDKFECTQLVRWRDRNAYNKTYAAKLIGVTRETYVSWENGEFKPNRKVYLKCSSLFKSLLL